MVLTRLGEEATYHQEATEDKRVACCTIGYSMPKPKKVTYVEAEPLYEDIPIYRAAPSKGYKAPRYW